MKGDDRSRRCDQCSLMVYNISDLTDSEVVDLIGKSEKERVCIRLRRRQDGSVITRDCPKGLAAYRKRAGKFVGTAFAAILGLFSAASAQRPPMNDSQGQRSEISVNASVVEGVVKDPTGVPIPGASVTIINGSGRTIKKETGRTGYFRIMNLNLDRGKNSIKIESPGFNSFYDEFSIHTRELLYYPVTLDFGFIGVVVIAPPPQIDIRKSETSTTIRFGD